MNNRSSYLRESGIAVWICGGISNKMGKDDIASIVLHYEVRWCTATLPHLPGWVLVELLSKLDRYIWNNNRNLRKSIKTIE